MSSQRSWYWERTWARLAEAMVALDPPAKVECAKHPNPTRAAEGWDLLNIDGVSLPSHFGDGAIYLWEPDDGVFQRTHQPQVFPMRRGRASALQTAKAIRRAVVDHEHIIVERRRQLAEQRVRVEAVRRATAAEWAEAVAEAKRRKKAFDIAVDREHLLGARVSLYVSDPAQNIAGGVFSPGGNASLRVEFDPWSPEEAREIVDKLVGAGLLRRGTQA